MTALIEIEHADACIAGRKILSDVSLSVKKGDFIELIGANGGGKTTLLRMLAGLLEPSVGTVRRKEKLRLGYLPQYRGIDRQFPITVREVVRSGLHNRKGFFEKFNAGQEQEVEDILAHFSLSEVADNTIEALSGGQWQRTLIARALVSRPDVLLLDEPETHLDADTKELLHATLRDVSKTSAIVRVSHDHAHRSSFHPTHIYEVNGCVEERDCLSCLHHEATKRKE